MVSAPQTANVTAKPTMINGKSRRKGTGFGSLPAQRGQITASLATGSYMQCRHFPVVIVVIFSQDEDNRKANLKPSVYLIEDLCEAQHYLVYEHLSRCVMAAVVTSRNNLDLHTFVRACQSG
jgi:hypothetical protein